MKQKLEVGKSSWFDIPVTDFRKSQEFYGELFGWNFMTEQENYAVIKVGEDLIGGLRQATEASIVGPKQNNDSPTIYITVDNIDEARNLAKKLGAQLIGDKVSTGENCGEFQLFLDIDQNVMAMFAAC